MNELANEIGIFSGGNSLLITNVRLSDKIADIFVDETGVIADVGDSIRKEHRNEAEFIIDGSGRFVLPGLVNTHTHAAMTLMRGYADDMHLQEWLTEKIWPLEAHLTGEDVYWGTKLACIEMIRSGTIAFNDMYFFMEDAARAVDETGMKVQLAYGFIDLFDEEKRETEIKATENLVSAIKSMKNPRIRAAVGPHAVYTVSNDALEWLATYSREEDIGIHLHLCETKKEVKDCVDRTGFRPVELLDRCNCLNHRTTAAHCCWLNNEECNLLANRGVHASHNPVSNMKLAVNRAMPYHWLRQAGGSITLGTDGCASNNSLDLFEEMKFAALLQKFYWNTDTLLPAKEALEMASTAGARALRLGSGRIETGAPADFILIDQSLPCMIPLHDFTSNVVYACNGSAVDTVLCDGRLLMLEREIPGEKEVLEKAAETAGNLVRRSLSGIPLKAPAP
jgi:5-methylthioadenosine/S-adenosylhomocysteine deaminase